MKVGLQIAVATLAITMSGQLALAEANNAAVLTEKLTQYYKPVKFGTASSPDSAPTLLTVRQPGILGIAAADASFLDSCPSVVRAGKVHRSPGFFCSELATKSQRRLKVSERVYATSILVSATFDRVSFYLAACGACTPDKEQASFRSLVVFEFSKGYLLKAALNSIVDTIEQVLTASAVTADRPASAPSEAARSDRTTPSYPTPEAPLTAAASTEPPVSAIVTKGQTPDAVEKVLGKPLVIFDLGTKLVYVYPNMKVFYVGGKLADVQ